MRFKNAVHAHDGTEKEKVAAAQQLHPRPPSMPIPTCFTCKAKGGASHRLRVYAINSRTFFCSEQCQLDGWMQKPGCYRLQVGESFSNEIFSEPILVGKLLSAVMRGGGHKGVLGTILKFV